MTVRTTGSVVPSIWTGERWVHGIDLRSLENVFRAMARRFKIFLRHRRASHVELFCAWCDPRGGYRAFRWNKISGCQTLDQRLDATIRGCCEIVSQHRRVNNVRGKMTRSERLLALMQMLLTRRTPVTAAIIADQFGVSERTVYRDILVLLDRGAVIRGEAGLGYVLDRGHFLPPLMFTPDEADAIVFGLRYVNRRGDADLSRAAEHALAKIASIMPTDLARSMQANGLAVQPELGAIEQIVGQIRQAIRLERKITFDYVNQHGTLTHRTGMPVAIGFFDDGAMLAAWCDSRQAFRHFRLDRMFSLHEQHVRFDRPHRSLLAEYRKIEPGMQP